MGVSPGSYMLASLQTAVAGQSVTLPSGGGVGTGLAVVAPGVVRGMLWLDSNTDGLRQPWEAPLAGANVILGGSQSTVTDQDGRYAFYNVSSGNYVLSAALPPGFQGTFPTVKVVDGRGEAVGLPVTINSGYTISLPLIKR